MHLQHDAWYAIQVRPSHERIARAELMERGYDVLLPTITQRRKWSDRTIVANALMFPSYVFARYDEHNRHKIVDTPAVRRIVGIGRNPIPIDSAELEAIERISREGAPGEPCPQLMIGQRVRVRDGVLEGLEGVYVNTRSGNRLCVAVTLLRRSVVIELQNVNVTPI